MSWSTSLQDPYATHQPRNSCFHSDHTTILMAIFLLISHSCLSSSSPILQFGKYFHLFITFCVSQVKFALRSSTVGTIIDQTSLLLLSEIYNLVMWSHASYCDLQPMTAQQEHSDRLIPEKVGFHQWVALAQGFPLALPKLFRFALQPIILSS